MSTPTISEIAASLPAELKRHPNFITWRSEIDDKGEPTKVPYTPGTNHRASTNDPTSWISYEEALTRMNGVDAGLGFVFSREVGLTGVDADHCVDAAGNAAPWAVALVARVPTYAELSPNDGIHLFVDGLLPEGHRCRVGSLELYTEKRFFTLTGNRIVSNPATITRLDLTWLYDLMISRVFDFESNEKYTRLMLGDWESSYPSQSEADLALCSLLANMKLDASQIDCVFRMSGLFRAKWDAMRGTTTYGAQTIATVLGAQPEDKKSSSSRSSTSARIHRDELPVMEVPHVKEESFTMWPTSTLEGDYIADLTHALTDGTSIPPQFARETIVLGLGALADGHLHYPGHELPMRRYLGIISEMPAAGKQQSYKRVFGESGRHTSLGKMLLESGIKLFDGGLVGSGQYLARVIEESPKLVLFWDELSELIEKSTQQSSTLFSALKKLFESNVHWSGSFANKKHGSDDVHLSVLLHCTRPSFTKAFSGKGSVGDGFLSRFVLTYAPPGVPVPEWKPRNYPEEDRLAGLLVSRIPDQVLVPAMEQDARTRMNEFLIELRRPDHPHVNYVQRLDSLTKVDLLHRVIYCSRTSEPRITLDAVNRSITWAEHQLKLRLGQWTADSGNRIEAMIQTIQRRLEKGPATEKQLKDAANVYRDGSHETFNRAMSALHRTSEIRPVGQTHKRTTIFALVKEEQ
jgi:hypothetical protein